MKNISKLRAQKWIKMWKNKRTEKYININTSGVVSFTEDIGYRHIHKLYKIHRRDESEHASLVFGSISKETESNESNSTSVARFI